MPGRLRFKMEIQESQRHLVAQIDGMDHQDPSHTQHFTRGNHSSGHRSEPSGFNDINAPSSSDLDQQTAHKLEENCYVSGYEFIGVEDSDPNCSRKWTSTLVLNWWLVEVSSLAMSILAVLAIVVVLRVFDGQPLPNWPYHVSQHVLGSVHHNCNYRYDRTSC